MSAAALGHGDKSVEVGNFAVQRGRMWPLTKAPRKLPKAGSDDEKLVQLLDVHRIDTVIDGGANAGQYAQRLRGAGYGGRVISIEPGAEAHAALSEAAAADRHWEVLPPMALGAAPGRLTLHLHNRSDMNSLRQTTAATHDAFPKLKPAGEETVDVATIDQLLEQSLSAVDPARCFLKLDTQGYEREILDGAAKSLPRIAGLQLELSLVALYEGEPTFSEMAGRLHGAGFDIHLVLPGAFSRSLMRQLQVDVVMFRR